jgi:hypothetical protein
MIGVGKHYIVWSFKVLWTITMLSNMSERAVDGGYEEYAKKFQT